MSKTSLSVYATEDGKRTTVFVAKVIRNVKGVNESRYSIVFRRKGNCTESKFWFDSLEACQCYLDCLADEREYPFLKFSRVLPVIYIKGE